MPNGKGHVSLTLGGASRAEIIPRVCRVTTILCLCDSRKMRMMTASMPEVKSHMQCRCAAQDAYHVSHDRASPGMRVSA